MLCFVFSLNKSIKFYLTRQICRAYLFGTLAHLSVKKAYSKEIKALGKRIKTIRISKKITQEALAGFCDIDVRTVQRIEKGEYGVGLHILFAISEALSVKTHDLFKE